MVPSFVGAKKEGGRNHVIFFFSFLVVSLPPLPPRLYPRVCATDARSTADMIHFETRTIGASRINLPLFSVSAGCDANAFHSHPRTLTLGLACSFILPRPSSSLYSPHLLYLFSSREAGRHKGEIIFFFFFVLKLRSCSYLSLRWRLNGVL